jgi:hypothetical protein
MQVQFEVGPTPLQTRGEEMMKSDKEGRSHGGNVSTIVQTSSENGFRNTQRGPGMQTRDGDATHQQDASPSLIQTKFRTTQTLHLYVFHEHVRRPPPSDHLQEDEELAIPVCMGARVCEWVGGWMSGRVRTMRRRAKEVLCRPRAPPSHSFARARALTHTRARTRTHMCAHTHARTLGRT